MTKIDLEQFEGHTKGPWHYHFFDGIDEKYHSATWADFGIQLPVKYGADVKLIAAAPELLKEVKRLRKELEDEISVSQALLEETCNSPTFDWKGLVAKMVEHDTMWIDEEGNSRWAYEKEE